MRASRQAGSLSLPLPLSLSAILINFYYFYKPWQSDSPALALRVGFVSSMGIYLAKGSTKGKESKKERKKKTANGSPWGDCLTCVWRTLCWQKRVAEAWPGGRQALRRAAMCLRYDFRNQNSARIGINLLPNVIKLFSDRTCIFHARSFPATGCLTARVPASLPACLTDCLSDILRTLISFYYYGT